MKNHITSCIYPVYKMVVWCMISKYNSNKQSCLFDNMQQAAMIFLERGSKSTRLEGDWCWRWGVRGRGGNIYRTKSQFNSRGETKPTHPIPSPLVFSVNDKDFRFWFNIDAPSDRQPSHPLPHTRTRTHVSLAQKVRFTTSVAGP